MWSIDKGDRPAFPRRAFGALILGLILAGVLALAVAEGWLKPIPIVGFVIGAVAFALIMFPVAMATQPAPCTRCRAPLHWQDRAEQRQPCFTCRTYVDSEVSSPTTAEASDPAELARLQFRRLAAEVIRDPRLLDDETLAALEEARTDARFNHRSQKGDAERLFRTYAAGLLDGPSFGPDQYGQLIDAAQAMTGRDVNVFDDPSWFADLGTQALIRAANGDWLRMESANSIVRIPPGEEVIWAEEVERLEPAKQELKHEGSIEGKIDIPVGAKVSSKSTLTSATKLPPGQLSRIDDATLVVTDRRILLVGHEAFDIEYGEVIGLSEFSGRVCRINRRNLPGEYVRGRSGALLCAVINSGARMAEGN